jgi:hypothetical protein
MMNENTDGAQRRQSQKQGLSVRAWAMTTALIAAAAAAAQVFPREQRNKD